MMETNNSSKERANLNKRAKQDFDKENLQYFLGIQCKPLLKLDCFEITTDLGCGWLCLSSALVLWIIDSLGLEKLINVQFNCLKNKSDSTDKPVLPNIYCESDILRSPFLINTSNEGENANETVGSCERPSVYLKDQKLTISGLSSVLRFLLKFSVTKLKLMENQNKEKSSSYKFKSSTLDDLLGFRGGCLQACAEVSVWTKFCELDMIKTLTNAIHGWNPNSYTVNDNSEVIEKEIPLDLIRLENHLIKPVRIFNIRKKIQSNQKEMKIQNEQKEIPIIELKHEYTEGPNMFLSDLMIFPNVYFLLQIYGKKMFSEHLPNILKWCEKLDQHFKFTELNKFRLQKDMMNNLTNLSNIHISDSQDKSQVIWKVPEVTDESLYKKDPARLNPESRLFTKQCDIEDALASILSSKIQLFEGLQIASSINWCDIPLLAHPEGGRLPEIRRQRKCQQLSCMAIEVLKVVEEKSKHNNSSFPLRIVDFCSGAGHLGILLAFLLPKCQIILVENKEESLRRGKERVEQLGLTNVTMFQCNLDYFNGQFEIGMALHACGTATDLVLSKCIAANASFVCCPCCYGAIQTNYMLHYPRSSTFQGSKISLRHYFILAHASDQTHDEKNEKTQQGKLCMRIIDTDRCLNAQDSGYQVYLIKMSETASCSSPKNHVLVGISSNLHVVKS